MLEYFKQMYLWHTYITTKINKGKNKMKQPTKILTSSDKLKVSKEADTLKKETDKTDEKTDIKKQTVKSVANKNKEEHTDDMIYKRTTNSVLTEDVIEARQESIEKLKTYTEDNLELKKMSPKERRKAKKQRLQENMEGMTKSQKIGYLIYYYKWKVLTGVLILFLAISLPITIYKNSRPVALSYALLNTYADIDEEYFQSYKDMYGYEKHDQIIQSNFSGLNPETYEEDYATNPNSPNFTQLPMLCYNGYFDMVIGDAQALEYCSSQSLIQPLDSALLPDIYNLMVDKYSDKIIESKNCNGEILPYAIDISDTEFAKGLELEYDNIYIGFTAHETRNFQNTKQFLMYVFSLNETK